MEEVTLQDGEYVIKMGAEASSLYFVKKGEVVCHKHDGAPRPEDGRVVDFPRREGFPQSHQHQSSRRRLPRRAPGRQRHG